MKPVREALESVAVSSGIGLVAGLLLWLVEGADLSYSLRASFNSAGEPFVFLAYLAPIALLGLAGGATLGAVSVSAGWVLGAASRAVGQIPSPIARRAVVVAAACAGVLFARLVVRALPADVRMHLADFGWAVAFKVPALLPFVDQFVQVSIMVAAAGGLVALLAVGRLATRADGARARLLSAAASAPALASVVAIYALDSRYEHGRHQLYLHIPLATLAVCAAFVAAACLRNAAALRPAVERAAVLGLLAAALGASLAGALHFGSNENLKALLWHRAVIGRHPYALAAAATDRDGDGFSGRFGPDLDDGNASIHPLAREVPGNDLDDNCAGGDLAATPAALEPVAGGAPTGFDFILVSIDTLRADRMSLYGYARPTTLELEEIARSGLVFDRAYSGGTSTGIAFAALNRSATRGAAVLGPGRGSLFRTLRDAGYATGQVNAIPTATWLSAERWRMYRAAVLEGVERYSPGGFASSRDAAGVTDDALAYIESLPTGKPHATWVHYFDPHTPREKLGGFDFGDSDSDVYDSEIAFTDREVGRLLRGLKASGRLERAVVVLLADHGEAFFEHGLDLHEGRPYDHQIWVPLVVWAPGLEPGRTLTPVSTIDVGPTVLRLLGLPPIPGAEGRDLLAAGRNPRPIFSETPANVPGATYFTYAVTDGNWRLLYDGLVGTVELYDLERDPLQEHNLADAEPERLAHLRAVLGSWLDATEPVWRLPGTR